MTFIISFDLFFYEEGMGAGIFEAPLTEDSTRGNLSMTQRVLLGNVRYLVGALPPLLYGDSIEISFVTVYILGSFSCSRFPDGCSKSI